MKKTFCQEFAAKFMRFFQKNPSFYRKNSTRGNRDPPLPLFACAKKGKTPFSNKFKNFVLTFFEMYATMNDTKRF